MKKFLLLALGAVLLSGCSVVANLSSGSGSGPTVRGSGKIVRTTRQVGSYSGVDISGDFDAEVTLGPKSAITIEGDDNILPHVTTEIKDGTLHIGYRGNYTTKHAIKVTMSVPALESAGVAGSGTLNLYKFRGKSLALAVSGSGSLKAEGEAEDLQASIAGSGDLLLRNLKSTDAKVSVSGSGSVALNVSGDLGASIAGSGDVIYYGHPKSVSRSVMGSGSIHAGD